MCFLFVFKLLLERKGGGIFGNHNLPSGDQKFILDRQLCIPCLKTKTAHFATVIKKTLGAYFMA